MERPYYTFKKWNENGERKKMQKYFNSNSKTDKWQYKALEYYHIGKKGLILRNNNFGSILE